MNANRRLRVRRTIGLAGMAVFAALNVGAWTLFPGPVEDRWPPENERVRIDVIFWDWHTILVLPTGRPDRWREWEYCERKWYLEGEQGFSGVVRALLTPSESGVARRLYRKPYWERHRDRNFERWSFLIDWEGLRRLKAYAESVREEEPLDGHRGWYRGARGYHVFYSCHHFTANALREAGLPIRPWWAYCGWMVKMQLDRISRLHRERGVISPAGNDPSGEVGSNQPSDG